MAELFYGDWTVEDVSQYEKNLLLPRFIIEGSRASDGEYLFKPTAALVAVSGPSWLIRFELLESTDTGRMTPMPLRRTGTAYTLEDGLVVYLKVFATAGDPRDIQLRKIVLRCRNVDPKLNPGHPFVNPYNFTLPKRRRRRKPTSPSPPR